MRRDCSYFHPGRPAPSAEDSRRNLHDRLQRGTSRSSRENDSLHPDRSAGSRQLLQRSTSGCSRENDLSSPYSHPQAADGSSSFGQIKRSRSRSSRENDQSSSEHRSKGVNKRSIQDAEYRTNNPEMHEAEGDALR